MSPTPQSIRSRSLSGVALAAAFVALTLAPADTAIAAPHDGVIPHDGLLVHESFVAIERPQDERRDRRGPRGRDASTSSDAAATDVAPQVSITVEGAYRVIRANGLPNHATGRFPTRGNPNRIAPQEHEVRIPLEPKVAARPTPARPEFGIAVNGVIFDAGTAEFWTPEGRTFGARSIWNYEAIGGSVDLGLDANHAHVQPTGKYHYHGPPTGLIASLAPEEGERMTLVGWAYDGFPIYGALGHEDANDADSPLRVLRSSYRLKAGERPASPEGPGGAHDGAFTPDWEYVEGSGDLDECNGRFGVTPEFPDGTYHYVVTEEFPYVPRLWRGTPDDSVKRRGPGARGGERGDRGRGGPPSRRRGARGLRGGGADAPPPPPPGTAGAPGAGD